MSTVASFISHHKLTTKVIRGDRSTLGRVCSDLCRLRGVLFEERSTGWDKHKERWYPMNVLEEAASDLGLF